MIFYSGNIENKTYGIYQILNKWFFKKFMMA